MKKRNLPLIHILAVILMITQFSTASAQTTAESELQRLYRINDEVNKSNGEFRDSFDKLTDRALRLAIISKTRLRFKEALAEVLKTERMKITFTPELTQWVADAKLTYSGFVEEYDNFYKQELAKPASAYQTPENAGEPVVSNSAAAAAAKKETTGGTAQPAAPQYAVNQKVDAMLYGKWQRGTVIGIMSDGWYRIHYDDFNSTWDDSVPPSLVRLPDSSLPVPKYSSPLWEQTFGISEDKLAGHLSRSVNTYYEGCRPEFNSLVPPTRLEDPGNRAFANVGRGFSEESQFVLTGIVGNSNLQRVKITNTITGRIARFTISEEQIKHSEEVVRGLSGTKPGVRFMLVGWKDKEAGYLEVEPNNDDHTGVFRFLCTARKSAPAQTTARSNADLSDEEIIKGAMDKAGVNLPDDVKNKIVKDASEKAKQVAEGYRQNPETLSRDAEAARKYNELPGGELVVRMQVTNKYESLRKQIDEFLKVYPQAAAAKQAELRGDISNKIQTGLTELTAIEAANPNLSADLKEYIRKIKKQWSDNLAVIKSL